jgi:predicted P-loop ATPase
VAGGGERVVTIHGTKMLKEVLRKGIVLHYERVWPQLVAAYKARVDWRAYADRVLLALV